MLPNGDQMREIINWFSKYVAPKVTIKFTKSEIKPWKGEIL